MNDATPPLPRRLPPDATLAGYDRWAATYDGLDNPMVAGSAFLLQQRPVSVTGRDVVELGCGTGRHAAPLLAAGAATFIGVDGSSGMLATARERGADPRARWLHADVTATPLPDRCCDIVLVVLVCEHLPTLEPLCREIARLLRPGGELRLIDIHPDLVANGTGAHFADGDGEVHFSCHAHPLPQLRAALTASGMRVDHVAETTATGPLLTAVPRLAKHAGKPVLVDVSATREH